MNEQTKTPQQIPATSQSNPATQRISSRELFNGGNELLIEHAGHKYRLRITRQNKLILTK